MRNIIPKSRRTIVKEMIDAETRSLDITIEDFLSKSASKEIVERRHAAVYQAIKQTDLSLAEIGRLFDLHHATVIYIKNKMRRCTDVVSSSCGGSAGVNPVEKIYAGCRATGVGCEANGGAPRKGSRYLVGYAGASRRRSIMRKHSIVDNHDNL